MKIRRWVWRIEMKGKKKVQSLKKRSLEISNVRWWQLSRVGALLCSSNTHLRHVSVSPKLFTLSLLFLFFNYYRYIFN